ncbi:MAG: tRNA 5-methoxyuridine(34)/uridine 5-oxyacetic acid(34) synthase CmoB [Rhodopirellula sp. TMED11]|nr:MAG: tRNA 5-methoxyuridine(34)/uridine 5-oxyacetic acid(34) synthase CmoB [Rhodopirellula sp. TMED11]
MSNRDIQHLGSGSEESPKEAWIDRSDLFRYLETQGQDKLAEAIRQASARRLQVGNRRELQMWSDAIKQLPAPETATLDFQTDVAVKPLNADDGIDATETLHESLMQFHPWRKGPLHFFGLHIDTEWRSDWKWERIKECVNFTGKTVLDVGCGNGYYGWRMLGAGASFVLGLDPILRYLMQFEVFHRYAAKPTNEPVYVPSHHVVPMIDTELPERCPFFDIVVSAGVLYHRTSPIDHLRSLHGMLKAGGQVVLETLIIDGTEDEVLVPEDRYARMRNVWFLPSIKMLERWLRRTGYQNITVADVNDTSTQEQRSTPWMTFQSLADFLDPNDPAKTIEGYSAPKRALLIATK